MVTALVKKQNVKNNQRIPIVFDLVNAVTMCCWCPGKKGLVCHRKVF